MSDCCDCFGNPVSTRSSRSRRPPRPEDVVTKFPQGFQASPLDRYYESPHPLRDEIGNMTIEAFLAASRPISNFKTFLGGAESAGEINRDGNMLGNHAYNSSMDNHLLVAMLVDKPEVLRLYYASPMTAVQANQLENWTDYEAQVHADYEQGNLWSSPLGPFGASLVDLNQPNSNPDMIYPAPMVPPPMGPPPLRFPSPVMSRGGRVPYADVPPANLPFRRGPGSPPIGGGIRLPPDAGGAGVGVGEPIIPAFGAYGDGIVGGAGDPNAALVSGGLAVPGSPASVYVPLGGGRGSGSVHTIGTEMDDPVVETMIPRRPGPGGCDLYGPGL